jgi:predicted secreted protein
VLHLSASAQTEVPQDWLVITLSVQKEGLQAPAVQKQLNAIVTAALAVATPMAKPGALEVKTGDMNVSPRYGRDGKMNGWGGSAQLILQGRDVEQITTLAGRMPDLTVLQIDWRLSPEQKTAAEARIQAEAVAHFQSKAQSLTKQFGFAAYTLREVRVSAQELGDGRISIDAGASGGGQVTRCGEYFGQHCAALNGYVLRPESNEVGRSNQEGPSAQANRPL